MIKAIDLNKTYRQGGATIEAVKRASLEISKKETVLITGPSGAGKSTLLHIVGGLDRPTRGNLFFEGRDFYALSDNARSSIRNEKIGFIFQFYHLLPEFTALENIMLPALMAQRGRRGSKQDIKKAAERLIGMVDLGGRIRHRPSELSGGESQRAAIARALINSPDILLCDEPTGNLDSKMGNQIIEYLWALKEKHAMALVIVTHDENIHDGFDKIFRIQDGLLEEMKSDKRQMTDGRHVRPSSLRAFGARVHRLS